MLTKREEYIKTFFIPKIKNSDINYMPEDEAIEIVKKISDIGNRIGFIGSNISQDSDKSNKRKHKYDVWIAKEIKKDFTLLDRNIDLRLIVDWAVENKIDLFSYDFQEAYSGQKDWHLILMNSHGVENLDIPSIENERVVFRFSDNKHFLYLLNEKELDYEGKKMGHCVGGSNYKSNVKNKVSLILSLRDNDNEPHVTIEIQSSSSMVVQQQGKSAGPPSKKYVNLLKEFILFASNFPEVENKSILKILNSNF